MFSILAATLLMTVQAAEPPAVPVPAPAPQLAPAAEPPVWLGVFLEDAADGGVQVLGLVPGGPAERGGLREGDVLLGVGEAKVPDLEALNRTLRGLHPGQRAELRLLRDGTMQSVGVLLGERKGRSLGFPDEEALRRSLEEARRAMARLPDSLGLELAPIPDTLRTHYGAPADAGALVVHLDPEGPGARAGLRVGDVLVRAGTRAVESRADVVAGVLAAPEGEVPLQVVRARKTMKVLVPRPAVPGPRSNLRVRNAELEREVERLRARVAELEAELEAELARTRRE